MTATVLGLSLVLNAALLGAGAAHWLTQHRRPQRAAERHTAAVAASRAEHPAGGLPGGLGWPHEYRAGEVIDLRPRTVESSPTTTTEVKSP